MWLALVTNPSRQLLPINPEMTAPVTGEGEAFLHPIPEGQERYAQFSLQFPGSVLHGQKTGSPHNDRLRQFSKRFNQGIFHKIGPLFLWLGRIYPTEPDSLVSLARKPLKN